MCKEIYSRVFKCCRYEGSAGLLLSQEITDVETSVGCGSALKSSELRLSQHRVGAGSTWPPRHEPLAAREAPGGGGGTKAGVEHGPPRMDLGMEQRVSTAAECVCPHLHRLPTHPLASQESGSRGPVAQPSQGWRPSGCCSSTSSQQHSLGAACPSSAGGSHRRLAAWGEEAPGSVRDLGV